MPRGKAPPPVVQQVVARLGAHVDADEGAGGGRGGGLAAREEVGPRAADGVLERVGQEGGQREGDEQAEDGGVVLVVRGAGGEVEGRGEQERAEAGVEDVVGDGDALDLGVREGEGEVGDGEEAVEGGREEDDERVGGCEEGEA